MLSQTTDENINKSYKNYTLDPRTRYSCHWITIDILPRYKNIPHLTKDDKILALYDTDNKEEMRYLEEKFLTKTYFDSLAYQNITRRLSALDMPPPHLFCLGTRPSRPPSPARSPLPAPPG